MVSSTVGGVKTLPPTALGASAITIRETPSTAAGSSATAASQTYTGVLNGHPEITENQSPWKQRATGEGQLAQSQFINI